MKTINEIRYTNLRLLMHSNGLRPSDLARWLAVSPQSVSQVLNGNRNIGDRLARKVEEAFKKTSGWLDRERAGYTQMEPLQPPEGIDRSVLAWESEDSLGDDFVLVPRLHVQASAGNGAIAWETEEKGQKQAFRKAWIERLGLPVHGLANITAEGSSMAPRIEDGDALTVNLLDTTIASGKVYALMMGDELFVKRLFNIPGGGLRIVSDNIDKSRFPDWDVALEQTESIRIIGRVVVVSGAL